MHNDTVKGLNFGLRTYLIGNYLSISLEHSLEMKNVLILLSNINWDAWIAEWSSHLTYNEQWHTAPWAVRSIRGDNHTFSAQA